MSPGKHRPVPAVVVDFAFIMGLFWVAAIGVVAYFAEVALLHWLG